MKSQTDTEKINDIIPTQEQKNAVENYVSGDGMYVNHYLRDGDKAVAEMGELRKEDKELISNLEKATSIKQDNKVLYRSVDASAVFGDISQTEYDALQDKLMYGFENDKATSLIDNAVGKTVTDKGFMSTTKDNAVALDFDGFTGSEKPVVIEFENADKALGLDLKKHMPDLDEQMEQSEVLLHNGTQYKIKSVGVAQDEYGGKSIYVKAEIVDDKLGKSIAKSADGGIINKKSTSLPINIQLFARKSEDFATVILPKKEYGKVMHEIATHLTEEQNIHSVFKKYIGNYVYTVENNGFGNYRIIKKRKIK